MRGIRWCFSLRPGYKHSASAYSQMFRTVCRTGMVGEVSDFLGSMKEDGVNLDQTMSKVLLDSLIRLVPLNLSLTRGGRRSGNRGALFSIRSEQNTEGSSGLDIWLGRGAMVGFAVAITVEIATGKGLLENFGVTGPLPTVALAVTALVGVLTAVFIFQSSSKN